MANKTREKFHKNPQESTSHKIYIFFSLRMRNPFLNLYKKLEV